MRLPSATECVASMAAEDSHAHHNRSQKQGRVALLQMPQRSRASSRGRKRWRRRFPTALCATCLARCSVHRDTHTPSGRYCTCIRIDIYVLPPLMSLLCVSRTCTVNEYTPDLFRIGTRQRHGQRSIHDWPAQIQNSKQPRGRGRSGREPVSARRHAARTSVNRLLTFVGWSLCGA